MQRANQKPPLQVAHTDGFVERARKRLAAQDAEREALVSIPLLRQHEIGPLSVDSEIAALRAKLAAMDEKRDALRG